MIEIFVLIAICATIGAVFLLVPNIFGAPWVPMDIGTVRKMLSMAEIKPGDTLYDLGSGDGRIIITAAKEFGAKSVGIEVNPLWVLWTRWRIRSLKLTGYVEVVWANFFHKNIANADVVTLYLLQRTTDRLRQKLEKELKPGTRVVSHVFTFGGWTPLNTDDESRIYFYKIGRPETFKA